MSQTAHLTPPPAAPAGWKHFVSLDNRYIAPIFITCILLVGRLSFGILESYQRTLLAIVVSIGTELLLGRIFFHKWVHPASAYISGHQCGHSTAIAGILAVRPVRGHLDHVEICVGAQRTPSLESVQRRHLGDAFSGPGSRGQPEHSMG